MALQIHGAEYPIRKVFSNDFAFSIPMYQRPYSWKVEQAGELLSDLLGTLERNDGADIEDIEPYFLGSIVLIKDEEKPDSQIVDGQQRLTTLSLLLAVLRRFVSPEFGAGLRDYLYEKGNPVAGTTDRFRLTIRERDADFFREYVQLDDGIEKLLELNPNGLSDPRRNIRDNLACFDEELRQRSSTQAERLAQFIVQRCYLVAVSTPDLDSAFRIFSVLNERGLDLSHADILKSETIGKIPEGRQQAYASKWEEIEDELGGERFSELFAHVRMIYARSKPRETVLQGFRRAVVTRVENPVELIDNVVVPYADAFSDVMSCQFESSDGAEKINSLLSWLKRIDNSDWVPAAIYYLARHRDSPDRLIEFLTGLERIAASMLIRRCNVNARIERYGRVLSAIDSETEFSEESPLNLDPIEKNETQERLDADLYLMPKVRLYVLLRLDAALSTGGAEYQYRTITVEHVLPQTPAEKSKWKDSFNEEAHAKWVHRLANLVLLTRRKNSEAQNFDFPIKKAKYFTGKTGVSPFQLTTQVLQQEDWSAGMLAGRQKELLGVLAKLWDL